MFELIELLKTKKICIYGMGAYGITTYYKFKEYDIAVECFGDRDERKTGYALEGLECRGYNEVLNYSGDQWLIIVAIENPQKIIKQFVESGFLYVYAHSEILREIESKFCKKNRKKIQPIKTRDEILRIKKIFDELDNCSTDFQNIDNENEDVKRIVLDFKKRNENRLDI